MKNHFLKKIFIVGSSILLLNMCSSPSTPSTTPSSSPEVITIDHTKTSNSSITVTPDAHPKIRFDYTDKVIYTKKEFTILDAEKIIIDSLYIQVAYELSSNRWILISRKITDDKEGLKMLLIDPTQSNKLLYRSRGMYDSMIMRPTFFLPNDKRSPWIILTGLGFRESWGQKLFFLKGDTINEITYLDIASKEEADYEDDESGLRLMDIAPYTSIHKDETGFNFNFSCDSIYYFGEIGNQVNPIFEASTFKYVFFMEKLNIELQL